MGCAAAACGRGLRRRHRRRPPYSRDCERVLGPDNPQTFTSRNSLAGAHESAWRLGEAIPLYEQTVAASIRARPGPPGKLTSQHKVARAYQSVEATPGDT